jgi:hypothetical protein
MILVYLNCRGLDNNPKTIVVKDLIRYEKPQILPIQETKMNVEDASKLGKIIW